MKQKEWLMILPSNISNEQARYRAEGMFNLPKWPAEHWDTIPNPTEEQLDEVAVIFEAVTVKTINSDTGKELAGLSDLAEWKTFVGMQLVTVPKLIGAGSYVESKHIAEREFSFTALVKGESIQDTEEMTDKILSFMMAWEPVKFHRLFLQDDLVTRQEILEGYITGFSDWTQYENKAYATFSVRCPEPEKTVIKINKNTEQYETTKGI